MIKECAWIPIIHTERLILRKLTIEDVEDLREWLGLDIVYKYWGTPAGKGEKNPELLFIDPRPHVKRKPSNDFIWGIEYRETNKIIGMIDVFDVENSRLGKVGYRFNPEFWNKGLCTEALKSVINFIFNETKIERLHAEADVNNIGSNHVLCKSGFIHEGCIRNGKMGNRYCTYNIYGMLNEDYQAISNKSV